MDLFYASELCIVSLLSQPGREKKLAEDVNEIAPVQWHFATRLIRQMGNEGKKEKET